MKSLTITTAIVTVLAILAMGFVVVDSTAGEVSIDRFGNVEIGMTLSDAEAILGKGQEIPKPPVERRPGGITIPLLSGDRFFAWRGEEKYIRVYLAFRNGKICDKMASITIPRHDVRGPLDAAAEAAAHFRSPTDAVVAFLEAVKVKDAVRLRKATWVRAPTEAMPKNRPLFSAILEQNLSEAEFTQLASLLEGFQAIGPTRMQKSGQVRFVVRKPGPNDTQYVRIFTTRWQKEPGWKVSDIGEQRELVKPIPPPPRS